MICGGVATSSGDFCATLRAGPEREYGEAELLFVEGGAKEA